MLRASLTDKNRELYLPNSLNWAYLQEFKTVRLFDLSIRHPVKNAYFVFDSDRPIYIGDRGCQWIYGKCRDPNLTEEHTRLKRQLTENAELVISENGFEIYKTH